MSWNLQAIKSPDRREVPVGAEVLDVKQAFKAATPSVAEIGIRY